MFWYLMNTMQTVCTLAPRSYLLVAMENWAKAGKPPQVTYNLKHQCGLSKTFPKFMNDVTGKTH